MRIRILKRNRNKGCELAPEKRHSFEPVSGNWMGGNGVSSSSPEPKIEARPARDTVAYRYAGAVRPDDLHNNRQAQSGSAGTHPFAAPEALENVWSILHRDARPAVLDADRPFGSDIDDHFSTWDRMRERVFDQIAQRIGNCGGVASDQDRVIGAGQRDRPAVRHRQMRH